MIPQEVCGIILATHHLPKMSLHDGFDSPRPKANRQWPREATPNQSHQLLFNPFKAFGHEKRKQQPLITGQNKRETETNGMSSADNVTSLVVGLLSFVLQLFLHSW